MDKDKTVGIEICTKDRHSELSILLTSLLGQTYKDWDLIIVDDSQTPITHCKFAIDIINRIMLDGHGVDVVINNAHPPLGVGKARNKANKENTHELGLRIDDDSMCDPNYIERLVTGYRALEAKGIKVGAVGGVVPPIGNPRFTRYIKTLKDKFNKSYAEDGKLVIGDDGGFCYVRAGGHEDGFEHGISHLIKSDHLRSSFLYNVEASRKIGGFPTEYGLTGWREETDWSFRMRLAGYELLTDPWAVCWHLQCQSGGVRVQNAAPEIEACENNFTEKFIDDFKEGRL